MLTRLNKILIGLLAVQLVLAVYVMSRGDGAAPLKAEPLLPGFDAAAVTRVQVFGDGKAKPVDLVKQGDGWVIASHYQYPADKDKVTAALSPIAKMAAAEPVATSATRHKQLKVGDAEFERKLVITAGGKDTTIYVGGAAGLRRTAVRIGGDDRVFGVTGVSTFAFGTQARDWIAGKYYQTPRDDITKIEIARGGKTLVLDRTPPAPAPAPAAGSGSASPPAPAPATKPDWQVVVDGAAVTPGKDEKLDAFAIDTIVGDVAAIDAEPADPKRDASTPTATITIHRKGGTDVLDVVAADDRYWVKQRGLDRATLVDKERLASALDADPAKLVTKETPPANDGAGAGSAALPGLEPPGLP